MSEILFKYELVLPSGPAVHGTAQHESLQEVMTKMLKVLKKNPTASLNMLEAHVDDGKIITDPKKLETLAVMVTLVAEQTNLSRKKNKKNLAENLRAVLSNPKKAERLRKILEGDSLDLPTLDKGDVLMVGKFKNRAAEITGFETDEHGQPVAQTTKGDQKIFKPRVAKLMPGAAPDKKDEAEVIDKMGKKTKQV